MKSLDIYRDKNTFNSSKIVNIINLKKTSSVSVSYSRVITILRKKRCKNENYNETEGVMLLIQMKTTLN